MSTQAPADGLCPRCDALDGEACVRPDGSARPNRHKARHASPPRDRAHRHEPGFVCWCGHTEPRMCLTWPSLLCACRGGLQPSPLTCTRKRERDRNRAARFTHTTRPTP